MFTLTPYGRGTWSMMDELESLQDDMNRLFMGGRSGGVLPRSRRVYPAINVWSSKDGLTLDAELPGADIKNVDISVEADQLTLSGSINTEAPSDKSTYHRRERAYGQFVRTLQLPFRADAAAVKANYKNGILRIKVPRSDEDKPHKIAIEAA